MFDKDADTEPQPKSVDAVLGEAVTVANANELLPTGKTIRYMDNTVFSESLKKVVAKHSRLLSKLAE